MLKKLKSQLQLEVDSAYLYQKLSEHYEDKLTKEVLRKMAEIEERHAQKVLTKLRALQPNATLCGPSLRARLQIKLGKYFGYEFILSNLALLESQIANSTIEKKQAKGEAITGLENIHLNIIQNIAPQKRSGFSGGFLSTFEGKHKSIGGNELRAAVLGANDGLVSNLSLVMGVAGATSGNAQILIAGIAGLIAGAISMALGEWLSVQSARELYLKQIEIEAEELENSPEEEKSELALLYQAKGMSEEQALKLANDVIADKETALDTLVKEELGIDKATLGGSPYKAAAASFLLFAIGAIIPVLPFFFTHGRHATEMSLFISTIGLFLIGAAITLYTGKGIIYSGLRQVIFGLIAALITYGIGKALGTTLLG